MQKCMRLIGVGARCFECDDLLHCERGGPASPIITLLPSCLTYWKVASIHSSSHFPLIALTVQPTFGQNYFVPYSFWKHRHRQKVTIPHSCSLLLRAGAKKTKKFNMLQKGGGGVYHFWVGFKVTFEILLLLG